MKRALVWLGLLLGALGAAFAQAPTPGRYRIEGGEPGWGAFRGEVRLESRGGGRWDYAGPVRVSGGSGVLRGTLIVGAGGSQLREVLLRLSPIGRLETRRRVGVLSGFVGNRAAVGYRVVARRGRWRQLSQTAQVRVMSFNVLGFKADWGVRRARVAAAIRAADPDVVCLQEVVGLTRGRSVQVNSLANQAGGYRSRFEGFRRYTRFGPWMGNAVLSRWPLASFSRLPLPRGPSGFGDYARGVTWARVAHPSGGLIDVGSLHLHQRNAPADRRLRVRQAQAAASARQPGSALRLLVGDFNARPNSATHSVLTGAGWRDLWSEARPGAPGFTASVLGSGSPKRIDYVFGRTPATSTLSAVDGSLSGPRTQGASGPLVSDHRALTIELRVERPLVP